MRILKLLSRRGSSPGRNGRPDVSVVVPVNAQGDLDNVQRLLEDLSRYRGPHTVETILVVNNFPAGKMPAGIRALRRSADVVLTIPDARRLGEAIGFSARIPGVRAASSPYVVLLDADCRVPNPTQLLNWYVAQFRGGAQAAYTHVAFHDCERAATIYAYLFVHHLVRWVKRRILGIPTTRGSNYAVRRDTLLDLYDRGLLADEMNVGPTFKRLKGRVVYGSGRRLRVLTSGRMFRPGWYLLGPYLLYRLRYNVRVLPVRAGVARRTGREDDPIRRYRDNRPVSTEDV
ncbi:MAG: glycosyltransferase [Gemmatimonadales bacterium]